MHRLKGSHMNSEIWANLDAWFAVSNSDPNSQQPSCAEVRLALDKKTKPQGSLGQLEAMAAQIALLQGTLKPSIESGRVIVFAADHGVAAEGVSAYPQEVSAQMLANFSSGGAAICALTRSVGMSLEVVDVGVKSSSQLPNVVSAKVAQGTANMLSTTAMDAKQRDIALTAGRHAVRRAVVAGTDCIGLGEMGIGNTTSASAIAASLLGLPAAQVTGRGTGVDDRVLKHKAAIVQQVVEHHDTESKSAMDVLACVGGFEIAAMVGAMFEAHERRLPVLVDGFISTAAAMLACSHEPLIRRCLFFSHQSAEAAHSKLLTALKAEPLLSLGMRLGEGSAAALAYPLMRSACAIIRDMSTFAEAGVAESSG